MPSLSCGPCREQQQIHITSEGSEGRAPCLNQTQPFTFTSVEWESEVLDNYPACALNPSGEWNCSFQGRFSYRTKGRILAVPEPEAFACNIWCPHCRRWHRAPLAWLVWVAWHHSSQGLQMQAWGCDSLTGYSGEKRHTRVSFRYPLKTRFRRSRCGCAHCLLHGSMSTGAWSHLWSSRPGTESGQHTGAGSDKPRFKYAWEEHVISLTVEFPDL